MKPEILLIFLLTVVIILIAAVYIAVRITWEHIDLISDSTIESVRNRYDPDFDPDVFREYISKLMLPGDYKLIFHSPFYERNRYNDMLNAHTGLPGMKLIMFSPGWVAVLSKNSDVSYAEDLFAFVLGHEITHREQPHRPIFLFGRKQRCASWIREIHADFGGLRKSGLSARRVSQCVRKEILRKRKHANAVSPPRVRHPSWEYRMKCWKNGQMETTVEMVCRDCGVNSCRFRDRMMNLYAA